MYKQLFMILLKSFSHPVSTTRCKEIHKTRKLQGLAGFLLSSKGNY